MKTQNIRPFIILMSVVLFLSASNVMGTPPAHPTVDGYLSPDDEYDETNTGDVWQGVYSKLYSRYIDDQEDEVNGYYICNDWYNPVEDFDPVDDCDAQVYNRFDWTDTGPNPDMFWRVNVLSNGNITVWQKENTLNAEWGLIDPNEADWASATGYNTTKNSETPHPVWELLIPDEFISDNIAVGLLDPKSVDEDDCPDPTDPNEIRIDYGSGSASSSGGC